MFHPELTVCPVFAVRADRSAVRLQGTGFFVAPRVIVSCNHVLAVKLEQGQRVVCGWSYDMDQPEPLTADLCHEMEVVYQDRAHDIAVGFVATWPVDDYMHLDSRVPANNMDAMVCEFSASHLRERGGGTDMMVEQASQRGHVIRRYSTDADDLMLSTPSDCIDLSFASLEGMSGAPVMLAPEWFVVGMMVGNVDRELAPAHVARVVNLDGGGVEEHAYWLPMGRAIGSRHIYEALSHAAAERPEIRDDAGRFDSALRIWEQRQSLNADRKPAVTRVR